MALSPAWKQELTRLCGRRIAFDVDMARHSTLRAGGMAAALAGPDEVQQAARLVRFCREQGIPWRGIGRGSNLLVRDAGFPGVLIRFAGRGCQLGEEGQVEAESGCLLAELLGFCRDRELAGLEFLTGIPGTVGGAVRMNAGAFGAEISQFLMSFSIIDSRGEIRSLGESEWHAGYRTMVIEEVEWLDVLLVSARFSLSPGTKEEIALAMEEYRRRRREKQQPALPSAGSFFKNPAGDYAGRLIEQAGLKGLRVGAAMVSREHANFIVNTGRATAADIISLMELVQEKVQARTGIFLEPEVHIL